GRVWSGKDAVRLGLADSLGGLKAAIKGAARLANLSGYSLTEYPKPEQPYEKILSGLSGELKSNLIETKLGKYLPIFRQLKSLVSPSGKVMARLPFILYTH